MTASRFPDAPVRVKSLPVERRGYPVPWFLSWEGVGEPDFRFVHPRRAVQAVRQNRCWVCGQQLGRIKTFAIGPMCAINRVSAEPPCHPECATFAAEACPFMSRPLAKRLPIDPDIKAESATPGFMIERNPGVTLLWGCLRFRVHIEPGKGPLFDIGEPVRLRWMREGRDATRDEILESIETGLPALVEVAEQDGPDGMAALYEATAKALKLVPVAA